MRREWEDKQLWVQSKRGLFGVKSFYSAMGYNDDFFVSPPFFFYLVGSPRKDPYHGQPLEAARHCGL